MKVETPPPAKPLDVVYTKRYKIDSPLWNHRAKALIVNWIPHCIEQIEHAESARRGRRHRQLRRGGARSSPASRPGRHRGYVFSNAWVHQTVEAMCIALMVDPQGDGRSSPAQEKMKATLEEWIPKILAAQEPDGYLQTAFTLDDAQTALVAAIPGRSRRLRRRLFHRVGDQSLHADRRQGPAAVQRRQEAGRLLGRQPRPARKKKWYDGHQEMEQALVRFGRFVNDMEGGGKGDDYIELAKFLLDCRRDGSEYDQSHVPVQQQYEAVGHAVRAVYSYSGMADVAAETGDLDYHSAVMSLWDNIVNKKYYVTGGIGSGETSEGFGPNYSLRNNAYCESCSSCGADLLPVQDEPRVPRREVRRPLRRDDVQRAVGLARPARARTSTTTNPLEGRRPRYPWHACPCCVGNIPRTLLMMPTWTYVKDDDGIYVNLFIGSTIKVEDVAGTDVEMVQKTDYPWRRQGGDHGQSGRGEGVRRARPVAAAQRERAVHEHAGGGRHRRRSRSTARRSKPKIENGYAVIDRTWKAGDKIELELPMEPQRVKCIDEVEANRGRVALRYGPLVYNIESVDGNNMDGVLGAGCRAHDRMAARPAWAAWW